MVDGSAHGCDKDTGGATSAGSGSGSLVPPGQRFFILRMLCGTPGFRGLFVSRPDVAAIPTVSLPYHFRAASWVIFAVRRFSRRVHTRTYPLGSWWRSSFASRSRVPDTLPEHGTSGRRLRRIGGLH